MAALSSIYLFVFSFKRSRNKRETDDLAMRQVLSVSPKRFFPTWRQWRQLPYVISKTEKNVGRAAIGLFLCAALFLGGWYVVTHRVDTPAVGGDYTEGLIGEPQFINPLYAAANDVDADLAKLIYSGLVKWDPDRGFINDLASDIRISEDRKIYTINIRNDAKFHDGSPVTASDVIFTYEAIQNPSYRSPIGASFQNVKIAQVDDRTVSFTLNQPFTSFLSTLTVGILPSGIWSSIPIRNVPLAELNLRPVGSGPFQFSEFTKDKKGGIRTYVLKRFSDFYGQKPYIETLTFKFYQDADEAVKALDERRVEGLGFIPSEKESSVSENNSVSSLYPSLPREVVIFFNQDKQPAFKDFRVRKAIASAIDKKQLVKEILHGRGTAIDAPLLPGMVGYYPETAKVAFDPTAGNILLDTAGYPRVEGYAFRTIKKPTPAKKPKTTEPTPAPEELTLRLTTVQYNEFLVAADLIAKQMAAIGIKIVIDAVDPAKFRETVLEPRAYEILLTGMLFGPDGDPYPFWHSSQTRASGLNLANYANRKADTLLEEARVATDDEKRAEKYRAFQNILAEDLPAVFLYQSYYRFALPVKIKHPSLTRINFPSDRFATIGEWFIKTHKTLR